MKLTGKTRALLLQTVFGLALLLLWLKIIDLKSLAPYIRRVNTSLVLIALSFGLVATILRTWRWKLILDPLKQVPFARLLIYGYLQALLNYFVPIRAGEVAVTYLIKKKYSIPFAKVLAITFLNRVFDFLAAVVIIVVSSLFLVSVGKIFFTIFWLSLLLLIVTITLLYIVSFREKLSQKLFHGLERLLPNAASKQKIMTWLKDFSVGLHLFKHEKRLLLVISLASLLSFCFDGGLLYFIFKAFGVVAVYPLVLFAAVLFTLSFMIPAAPLYVGSTEVAGSLIFVFLLGLGRNVAASVTVFWHLLNTFLIITLGLLAVWVYRWKKL